MAIHKLVLDDVEADLFTLIAIHCTLEDYRLAYLLNKFLGITLSRRATDLDFKNGAITYAIFEWEDSKQQTLWHLVSNVCKTEVYNDADTGTLFSLQEKITKTNHLIPEYRSVNYFLKIDNEFLFSKEKYILNSILKIPQVATAYTVEPDQLKSKDHLIFS